MKPCASWNVRKCRRKLAALLLMLLASMAPMSALPSKQAHILNNSGGPLYPVVFQTQAYDSPQPSLQHRLSHSLWSGNIATYLATETLPCSLVMPVACQRRLDV